MGTTELDELRAYSRTQDAQVFGRLVDSHGGLVYGVCLRMLGNPADAEDVAQETFLALARKAGEVRTSVAGWLHARATTLCLTRLQRERNRRAREQEYAAQHSELGAETTWEQIGPEVDRALAELPDEVRNLLVQHFLQRRQQAQLAAEMDVSPATISRRLAEGVELLRSKLQLRGIGVSSAVLGPMLLEHGFTEVPATLVTELGKMALAGLGQATSRSLGPIVATVAAIAVVGVVAAGIWATGNGPAATAATKPTEAGVQVMNTSREVLEGVPRVGYNVHVCPFPGSLYASLQYMGEKPDYDLISATSGAAWRRFYNRDDGGNVDLMYLGDTVWEHAFTALGLEYQHVPPTDRDAVIKAVKASIDANRPVISFGIHGPPEAGVIAGYDNDGQTLIGWNYFFDNQGRYYEKADWQPCLKEGLGFVVIGQKKPRPSDRETLISTLRFAIDLARTPKRQSHPDHVTGLAAYEAWADGLLVDADFLAGDKKELDTRTMILGDQLAMLIERRYGGNYLRKMAPAAPEARAELEAAAALLTEVAQTEAQISRGGGSFDHRNLVQRSWRMQMADAIREAGQKEQQAVLLLEQALDILQPILAEATLSTPEPADLTQNARWQIENIPLGIVFRAAMDVTGDDFGREVKPDGWSADHAYDLMQGATGEGFRFGLNITKEGKHIAFRDYGAAFHAAAFRRALEALRYEGEVLATGDWASPDALRTKVISAIGRQHKPVILADVPSPGHYALIVGYENAGQTLIGYNCEGGGPPILFEPEKRRIYTDWAAKATAAVIFRERIGYPDDAFVNRRAIEQGLAILRGGEHGDWLNGPALYDAWAAAFAPDVPLENCANKIDPYIWDLAERRHYCRQFLQRAAKAMPASARRLEAAAEEFGAIHDLMWKIAQTATERPQETLVDPQRRQAIAEIIQQAKAHDIKAAELLEDAVAQ